jgi:hypothetical protein
MLKLTIPGSHPWSCICGILQRTGKHWTRLVQITSCGFKFNFYFLLLLFLSYVDRHWYTQMHTKRKLLLLFPVSIMKIHFSSFFPFDISRSWTLGLVRAWQGLYHLSHAPSPFCICSDRVSFFRGMASECNPPTCASRDWKVYITTPGYFVEIGYSIG